MSLLWKDKERKKLLTIHERPSPICDKHILYFAQSIIFPHISRFIKGISMLISSAGSLGAGMTVEASVCLPLFLFFFLNIGSAIEMIRLHGNLQLALWEVGSKLSVYGHVLESGAAEEQYINAARNAGESDSWGMELAGVAMSYTYVKSRIIEYLGETYLENAPLSYGTGGLQFVESNLWETDGKFEVTLTYAVSPLSSMAGYRSFRMANKYYGHLWNGYKIGGVSENGSDNAVQYVYVTENGEVYHTNRSCTHLTLSIRQVSIPEARTSRNQQGVTYEACEKCSKWAGWGMAYITAEGRCYHYEKDCPGLKRTVYAIPLSEIQNKRICQRCNAG